MNRILILAFFLFSTTAFAVPEMQKGVPQFHNIQENIAWFEATEKAMPANDTRALFLRIYHSVTLEMSNMFAEKQFHHPDWVSQLMLKYVSLYRNALECDQSKKCAVSPAWQLAFQENERGRISPAGQLLLSISAHVNRDLPVALASLESTKFEDETYLEDFQRISLIFQRRMPNLIKILQDYESCHVDSNDEKNIQFIIQWAIGGTRRDAWNLGAQLAQVKSFDDEKQMLRTIESHAHLEDISIYIFAPAPAFIICQ